MVSVKPQASSVLRSELDCLFTLMTKNQVIVTLRKR